MLSAELKLDAFPVTSSSFLPGRTLMRWENKLTLLPFTVLTVHPSALMVATLTPSGGEPSYPFVEKQPADAATTRHSAIRFPFMIFSLHAGRRDRVSLLNLSSFRAFW